MVIIPKRFNFNVLAPLLEKLASPWMHPGIVAIFTIIIPVKLLNILYVFRVSFGYDVTKRETERYL